MPDVTANLNLNVPFAGENVGDWHLLANPNWRAIDAVFAGLGSTTSGGTGHVHNGLPGQGPRINHDDLTNAGTKSHTQIEIDITNVFSRIENIENTYCADVTCGGPGGGGVEDPHPPVHYTENFTTELGTRLAQMDWLVSSDSSLSDFQVSGHSGYLSTAMGYPFTDRYAAVVKCQIPHIEAQRITYHITRFTADGLADGDSIMMVMALYSTHLLGPSTPYIHYCGIKMIIILSKQGGTYSVTRQAIAEVTDNDTHLLKQDHADGLTFNQAEIFFRGCHEWSVDNNGACFYYHNRAPVWILPAGTASPYFPQITATLLGLQEPPFGSIGFGWAWNLVPSATFDVEKAWLTIDSKANILEPYTTNYPDPGNDPPPFEPIHDIPCCNGAGPNIGETVSLGNGLESKVVACVEDPWKGALLENGMIWPCSPLTFPPAGDPGAVDVDEGSEFVREIPIDNMTPEVNTDWIVNDPDGVLADYRVEVNLRGVTVSGETNENTTGLTVPTIDVWQTTDMANTLTGIPIVNVAQIGPTITGIDTFDRDGDPLPGVDEGTKAPHRRQPDAGRHRDPRPAGAVRESDHGGNFRPERPVHRLAEHGGPRGAPVHSRGVRDGRTARRLPSSAFRHRDGRHGHFRVEGRPLRPWCHGHCGSSGLACGSCHRRGFRDSHVRPHHRLTHRLPGQAEGPESFGTGVPRWHDRTHPPRRRPGAVHRQHRRGGHRRNVHGPGRGPGRHHSALPHTDPRTAPPVHGGIHRGHADSLRRHVGLRVLSGSRAVQSEAARGALRAHRRDVQEEPA
jgi:hypothetical protein